MEETEEIDITNLTVNTNNVSSPDQEVDKSVAFNGSESSNLAQTNLCENMFDLLKENNKHIFVLSTAGKPIYTR